MDRPTREEGARLAVPGVPVRPPQGVAANCRSHGDAMYPEHDNTHRLAKMEEIATSLCTGCPIRGWCHTAGKAEEDGVWGGQTPAMRSKARWHKWRRTGQRQRSPEDYRLLNLIDMEGPDVSSQAIAAKWDVGPNAAAGTQKIQRLRRGRVG